MSKPKPHHSHEQLRDPEAGRFRGSYARQRLHFVLRTVAFALHPDDPLALTQPEFDLHAATVMETLGEPAPTSARAIYMRLNKERAKRASWRELIEESLREEISFIQTVVNRSASPPDWSLDERHIWYSLRRACAHLGRPEGPIGPDQYERAYEQLLAESKRRPGSVLADCLATKSQILGLCEHDWAIACRVAQIAEPPTTHVSFQAHDPLKLLTHFYYVERRLPTQIGELHAHARAYSVIGPNTRGFRLAPLKREFVAERAGRGLQTPKDGPARGDELSPTELTELLAGGSTKKPRGHWTSNPELVLDALAAYIDQYEHTTRRLGQKHYLSVYQEHDWPAPAIIGRLAKKLLPDKPRAGFNAMLQLARRHAHEMQQRAA